METEAASGEKEMTTTKKLLALSWILGIVLFASIIIKIGPAVIWNTIRKMSWTDFLILVLLRLLYWVWRTIGWAVIYREYEEKKISFFHLFAARLADHAINYTTPTMGEPVRVLMTDCENRKKCLASVVVDKTIEILTMVIFIIIGTVIAVIQLSIPGRSKTYIAVTMGAACFFGILLLIKQQRGLFRWMIDSLSKIGIRPVFIRKYEDKIRELDEHIAGFYRKSRKAFAAAFVSYMFLFLFWALEIHMTLVFLGETHVSFGKSFLVVTLGSAALIFPFIPASLGLYELTNVILFAALGLGTRRGASLTIIRRIVTMPYVGMGILAMARKHIRRNAVLKA